MATYTWSLNTPTGVGVAVDAETISIKVTTGGDNVVAGSGAMIINGVTVTPVETANAVNDYDLTYTIQRGDLWYATSYTIQVEVDTDDLDTGRFAWTFTTVAGVTLRTAGYQKSQMTQVLANNFPPWSRVRNSEGSVGQMLLNAVALPIEDARQEVIRQRKSHFLQTADRNDMDLLYRLKMAESFDFDKRFFHDGDFEYLAPTLTAVENIAAIPIAVEEELEALWDNAIPDRITGESSIVMSNNTLALGFTAIENFPIIDNRHDVQVPGYLFVEFLGGANYVTIREGAIEFSQITLKGTSRYNMEEQEETIVFERPGIKKTSKEWRTITDVFVAGITENAGAQVALHNFMPKAAERIDSLNQVVTKNRQVYPSHWELVDGGYSSVLRQSAFIETTALDIFRGETTTPFKEYELLNVAGNPVHIEDFCLDRNRRFMWGITPSTLYCWDLRQEYFDNLAELENRTIDNVYDIDIRPYALSRNHTDAGFQVGLRRVLRNPRSPATQWRWSIILPDGTTRYTNSSGTLFANETSYVEAVSRDNYEVGEGIINVTLGAPGQAGPLHGTYIFVLELHTVDGVRERVMEPFHIDYLQAVGEYDLALTFARTPVAAPAAQALQVQCLADAVLRKFNPAMRVVWDSDDRIRIIRDATIHTLGLKYDRAVIDFERREIFFRENFDSVRVT